MANYDYLNNYLNSNMNRYDGGGYLTQYNTGGTHEQNPNGGIPLGEDASVEQGETSVDVNQQGAPSQQPTGSKYIFSDRQIWTPEEIKYAGLPVFGKNPLSAAEYTTKLFGKSKGREGDLAAKETLKTFTQRAQQLAETKRQAEELAINQAMLANSQQVAPENAEVPEGMEEYAQQPQEQIAQAPMQMGLQDGMMAAQGGYFTRHKYSPGGYRNDIGLSPSETYKFGQSYNTYDAGLGGGSATNLQGLGSGTEGASSATGATTPGAGAYVGAATTGLGLFSMAKDGTTSRDAGKAALTGAAQGAAAGAAFGPWGAAIGGVVGAGAGVIGSKKAERNYRKEISFAGDQANAGMPNADAWSGLPTLPLNRPQARGGYITSRPARYADGGIYGPEEYNKIPLALRYTTPDATPGGMMAKTEWAPTPTATMPTIPVNNIVASDNNKNIDWSKFGKKAGELTNKYGSDIARAYPILSNIQQRGALTPPTGTYYAKLNDAYNVPQVDEARYSRDLNSAYNNQLRAIGQSGGSQGQQRAGLLAAGAQDIQRRGKLAEGIEGLKMQRAMQEQQFKSGIAQYNAQSLDKGTETYAQDLGNYETQKSKLTGAIGTDIGEVAKEQTHMKQVAAMYGYDWNGKYLINRDTGKPATQAELLKMRQLTEATADKTVVPATNINTVNGQTGTMFGAMGGYLTRRKARY